MQVARRAQPHPGVGAMALAPSEELVRYADRQAFVASWHPILVRASNRGSHVAALLIAVDGLDELHNLPGLPMRARTLDAVASALSQCVRTEDEPAQIGEDEFALAVGYWEEADLLHLADRVRTNFELTCENYGINCSLSIGIAGSGQHPVDRLMEIAGRSLEYSRNNGGAESVRGLRPGLGS